MARSKMVSISTRDGLHGKIDTSKYPIDGSQAQTLVRFEEGQEVWVPVNLLEKQKGSTYHLPVDLAQIISLQKSKASNFIVLPVIEETLKVGKRQTHTGGLRVIKKVHEHEEVVDEAGYQEEIQVERVQVNRVVENPVSVRHEGDTIIVPVLEEQLVVEKRLVLKEELHITRLRKETREPQKVSLRSEEVIVERIEPEGSEE